MIFLNCIERKKMLTLEFVTNTQCNLGCYYCFACLKKDNDVISLENSKKAIDLLYEFSKMKNDNNLFIKIYGGEPLLFKERIFDIIKYIKFKSENEKNINYEVAIITNATLLTKDFLEQIKESGNNKVTFTISLEYSEESHNKIRFYKKNKTGSFNDLIHNVSYLADFQGYKRVHAQIVLSPDLLENVKDFINFMDKYKDNFQFDLVPMFDCTFVNKERLIKNMKELFNYYIKCFNKNDYYHVGTFQQLRSLCSNFSKESKTSHCHAGTNQITVMPNGDVYPCSLFFHNKLQEYKYGSLNTDTFEKILIKRNSFESLFQQLTKKCAECNSCEKNNNFGCLGQCVAHKLQKNKGNNIKSVCKYNIEFGKQSNRFLTEIKNKENLLKRANYFQTNKFPEFHKNFINFLKGSENID